MKRSYRNHAGGFHSFVLHHLAQISYKYVGNAGTIPDASPRIPVAGRVQ